MKKYLVCVIPFVIACGGGASEQDVEANTASIADLQTQIAALRDRVTTLEGMMAPDIAPIQAQITANAASITSNSDAIGVNTANISGLEGITASNTADIASNTTNVATNTTALMALETSVAEVQASTISEDTTWMIGAGMDYEDLVAAVEAAKAVRVMPNATLTLQLAPGMHTAPVDEIVLNHQDGLHIELIGDESDASLTTVQFTGSGGDGIVIASSFSRIAGITFDGNTSAVQVLRVDFGSATRLEEVTTLGGVNAGLFVGGNAAVFSSTVELRNSGRHGVQILDGGVFFGPDVIASGNASSGASVRQGAVLHAPRGTFEMNGRYGVAATLNSTVVLTSGQLNNNTADGVQALDGTAVSMAGATTNMNGESGAAALFDSFISATNLTSTGNTAWGLFVEWSSSATATGATLTGNAGEVPGISDNMLSARGSYARR